jgi:hypothetical protein
VDKSSRDSSSQMPGCKPKTPNMKEAKRKHLPGRRPGRQQRRHPPVLGRGCWLATMPCSALSELTMPTRPNYLAFDLRTPSAITSQTPIYACPAGAGSHAWLGISRQLSNINSGVCGPPTGADLRTPRSHDFVFTPPICRQCKDKVGLDKKGQRAPKHLPEGILLDSVTLKGHH